MPHMLITAGPTHEPIDAVRYIANRSSGAMGAALTDAAMRAGWEVTLLLGPCAAKVPEGMRMYRFTTAAELQALLEAHFPACDVLIMAAAVADYRPPLTGEPKRPRGREPWTLQLEPTPDLLAACAARKRREQVVIGFALEPAARLEHGAAEKLRRKNLDAIVANPLETMGSPTIDARLFLPSGRAIAPGLMSKPAFADWLIGQCAALWSIGTFTAPTAIDRCPPGQVAK